MNLFATPVWLSRSVAPPVGRSTEIACDGGFRPYYVNRAPVFPQGVTCLAPVNGLGRLPTPRPALTCCTFSAGLRQFDERGLMTPLARVFRSGVRLYRAIPRLRPPVCRFDPSCSAYAIGALEVHGALKGTVLAVRRVGRCQPWGGHGYDPVPARLSPARTEVSCST